MSTELRPEGIKFSGNDTVQTKPVITVGGVGPNTTGENIGDVPLDIVEIQSGDYLGEDDIVRFSDRYGRVEKK